MYVYVFILRQDPLFFYFLSFISEFDFLIFDCYGPWDYRVLSSSLSLTQNFLHVYSPEFYFFQIYGMQLCPLFILYIEPTVLLKFSS